MLAHCGFDAGVVAEAFEELARAGRVGEVGEWEDGVEGVGCFVLGFAPIAGAGWGGVFEDGRALGKGRWAGDGGDVGGCWGEEDDFLGLEGLEREGWVWEGRF